MGGLVIRIAKKPKSVQVTESEKELAMKERKKQAFLDHVARVRDALSGNIKEETKTDNCKPYKTKPQCPSVSCKTKRDNLHSVGPTNTDNPRKRKVHESSQSTGIQNKRARVDTQCKAAGPTITDNPCKRKVPHSSQSTIVQNKCARVNITCKAAGSAIADKSRKRKAPDSSKCTSIQNKYARLDTGSAVKAPKHSVAITDNPHKRKTPDSSKCTSIQNKYARLDTGSAIKALKRHLDKRQH